MNTLWEINDEKYIKDYNNKYRNGFVDVDFSQEDVISSLKYREYSAVVLDGDNYPLVDLISLSKEIININKSIIIIILGEHSDINTVAGTIGAGAYDYLLKPIDIKQILKILEKAYNDQKLKAEKLKQKNKRGHNDDIIGTSKSMINVFKTIGRVANSTVPVIVSGESGTGKETVAKAIHKFSNKEEYFFKLICSVSSNKILEQKIENFYEKILNKPVYTTIFLQEISEMSLESQFSLIRILNEYESMKDEFGNSYIRLIASAKEDLETLILEEKFSEELYHKLNGIKIEIPPLRERKDDIPFLVDKFLVDFNNQVNKNVKGVSKPAMEKILKYDWPGNIKGLKNAIKSSVAVCRGSSLLVEDLPSNVIGAKISKRHGDLQDWVLADWIEGEMEILNKNSESNYFENIISRAERELIRQVLEKTNGKKVDAARTLGITRNTLRAKMNNYGLD